MDILDSLDLTLRALNTRIPEVDPQRCVATRYQSSSCRRCVRVCPGDAVEPAPSLEVDPQKCLGCGACAVVCPTGALDFAQPRSALRAALRAAAKAGRHAAGTDGIVAATVACTQGDLSAGQGTGIRVDCLGSIAAGDLLLARAMGAETVHLVDGDCDGCRLEAAVSELPDVITAAGRVAPMTVTRVTSPGRPDESAGHTGDSRGPNAGRQEVLRKPPSGARSAGPVLSRRQFLLFFGLRSAKLVETSVKKPDHSVKALHAQKEPPVTHRLLRETLAMVAPGHKDNVPDGNVPDDAGTDAALLIQQLHLARVAVGSGCDGCGLCVRYCPHGALRNAGGGIVADPALCTACGLCVEVCPPAAARLDAPTLR